MKKRCKYDTWTYEMHKFKIVSTFFELVHFVKCFYVYIHIPPRRSIMPPRLSIMPQKCIFF